MYAHTRNVRSYSPLIYSLQAKIATAISNHFLLDSCSLLLSEEQLHQLQREGEGRAGALGGDYVAIYDHCICGVVGQQGGELGGGVAGSRALEQPVVREHYRWG
jgi:hypothetical protein